MNSNSTGSYPSAPKGVQILPDEHANPPTHQASVSIKGKRAVTPVHIPFSPLDVGSLTRTAKAHIENTHLHTPKVASQLRMHHDLLMERHEMVTSLLTNSLISPLERIKALVSWTCEAEEVEPPTDDPLLWSLVEKAADMLCAKASSPNRFDPLSYPDVLRPVTEGELGTNVDKTQKYYLRFYLRSRKVAQEEFVTYMERQPIDACFSTSRMAINNMSEVANNTLANVLHICGFAGAEFTVVSAKTSPDSMIQEEYGGTTIRTAFDRHRQDLTTRPHTRFLHFLSIANPDAVRKIQLFEIYEWRREIISHVDWRQQAILSDLERILLICSPSSLNSSGGGFIPKYRLRLPIRQACERVIAALPRPPKGLPDPQLSAALDNLIDEEVAFIASMREKGYDLGPDISKNALFALKQNVSGHVLAVNGMVVDMDLLNEVPNEDFRGRITPGFFSHDMGRSMALHWDRLQIIHGYDGVDTKCNFRQRLGIFLNIWKLIIVHKWWGLMIMMVKVILERLKPLLIVGFGASAAHMFLRSTLAHLASETRTKDRLAMDLLDHPRIQSLMSPPQFPQFLDSVGTLHIVSTGTEPHELALYLPAIHPGREFYRPWLLLRMLRVGFMVTFKGHISRRVVAHLVSTCPPDDAATSRRAFLLKAKAEVERRMEGQGLDTLLSKWIQELQDAEAADGMLRGKHVVHGDLVKSGLVSKCYAGRESGSVAAGQSFSPERFNQLEQFQQLASISTQNGLSVFTGPQGCQPHTELFKQWLLSRDEGVSLLWSANRYGRSPEAFKVVQADSCRLALFNKLDALKKRQADAERYGGHRRAVLLRRFEVAAADVLRGKCTPFAQATRAATCVVCLHPDIGHDQNTKHRCRIEDEVGDGKAIIIGARGKPTGFKQYLRILFLHDLMDYPRMAEFLNEEDIAELGIYSTTAVQYLIGDDGQALASLPPGLDLTRIQSEVIWRREDTNPVVLLASALVVALREMAKDHDRESNEAKLMAGSLYAREQDKMWANNFAPSVVRAISSNPEKVRVCLHRREACQTISVRCSSVTKTAQCVHKCTRGTGIKVDANEYEFIEASRFVELPYVLTRFCVYKALVEDDDEFKRVLMWG